MALIIKGEMPKGKCWWHDEQGKEHECQFFPCTRDADNCPIIGEIPDKHGRLIDVDELKASIHMNHLNKFATIRDVQVLYKLLNEAPTVLEASNVF